MVESTETQQEVESNDEDNEQDDHEEIEEQVEQEDQEEKQEEDQDEEQQLSDTEQEKKVNYGNSNASDTTSDEPIVFTKKRSSSQKNFRKKK